MAGAMVYAPLVRNWSVMDDKKRGYHQQTVKRHYGGALRGLSPQKFRQAKASFPQLGRLKKD